MNTPGFERPFFDKGSEYPTALRYSFARNSQGVEDNMIEHPAGKMRIVRYPLPTLEQRGWRNHLIGSGLVLGTLLEDDNERSSFKIPVSSRPIIYDAQSDARGLFSYGDAQMIQDLGNLLGTVAREDPTKVLARKVAAEVAFVEFTHPGERRLFFVPGIERRFQDVNEPIDARSFYADLLEEECGERFTQFLTDYYVGFDEASHEA